MNKASSPHCTDGAAEDPKGGGAAGGHESEGELGSRPALPAVAGSNSLHFLLTLVPREAWAAGGGLPLASADETASATPAAAAQDRAEGTIRPLGKALKSGPGPSPSWQSQPPSIGPASEHEGCIPALLQCAGHTRPAARLGMSPLGLAGGLICPHCPPSC